MLLVVAWSLLAVAQSPERADAWRWQGWAGTREGSEQTLFLRSRGLIALPGLGGDAAAADGVTEFVAEWLRAHPQARVEVAHRFADLPWSWALVRDGDAVLNVELVRAGWTSAPNMVDDPGLLRSLAAPARQTLLAAIDAAEVEALERRAGRWGRPGEEGARQWRLGERAFERRAFAAALEHYDAARAAGHEAVWLDAQRAACLRELGREDEASFADERALEEAVGGFAYQTTLEQALRARAEAVGVDAALAWGRRLRGWNPDQIAHHQVLAAFLLGHRRAEEAARIAVPALQRLQEEAGLVFDGEQRLLWDDALMQPPPPRLRQPHELLPLYEVAAAACAKAERRDEARVWRQRGRSLEAVMSGGRSRTVPNPLPEPEAATASIERLAQALRDVHPSARRVAAAEVLRRLEAGVDDEGLRACAVAVFDAQGRAEAWWFTDQGRVVEAAWARGLLSAAERTRYLTQAVRGVDVFVAVTPVGPSVVSLACQGRLRLSPGLTVAQPEREFSQLDVVLEILTTRVDGRTVAVVNRDDEQPPRRVSLTAVFGGARDLDWQPQPGRHLLDLDGVVVVTGRGKGGGEPTTVRVPVAVRAPFFSVR